MIFDALLGNEDNKASLGRLCREGRLPHAILLLGERGSGRFTLARLISAVGVCRVDDAGCGTCPDCKMALAGIHPDVEVYAKSDAPGALTIKSLREINRGVATPPVQAKRRVVILRDIQDAAQIRTLNALLKVIEEPPEYLMFVITADSRDNLLPTIVSRCLTLRMQPPELSVCASRALELAREAAPEKVPEEGAALRCAVLTGRNIGRTAALLSGAPEAKAMDDALALAGELLRGDRYAMLHRLRAYERDRAGWRALLGALRDVFGRILLERSAPREADAAGMLSPRLFEEETARLTPAQGIEILSILGETAQEARQNVNLPLALTRLTARLCSVAAA